MLGHPMSKCTGTSDVQIPLLLFCCALFEALYATGLVEHAVFARVKWVRFARDFNRRFRIHLPFELRRFGRGDG